MYCINEYDCICVPTWHDLWCNYLYDHRVAMWTSVCQATNSARMPDVTKLLLILQLEGGCSVMINYSPWSICSSFLLSTLNLSSYWSGSSSKFISSPFLVSSESLSFCSSLLSLVGWGEELGEGDSAPDIILLSSLLRFWHSATGDSVWPLALWHSNKKTS